MPDHLVAILVDPLMQKFMMLRPDKDLKRASAWIGFQVAEFLNGDADAETVANTIKIIHEYARSTKVGTLEWSAFARPYQLTRSRTYRLSSQGLLRWSKSICICNSTARRYLTSSRMPRWWTRRVSKTSCFMPLSSFLILTKLQACLCS